MHIGIFASEEEVADAAANHLFKVLAQAENKTLGVATGSTPLPLYERMRQAHARGDFSLADFHAYALDEYVGIDADHPERYRNVLRTELVGSENSGLLDENLHTPDGNAADATLAAAAYEKEIQASGGVSLQILGIGADGHIGFNEPGISLSSRTHVDALTKQTREDNMRFFDNDISRVPAQCITQGLATIMDAQEILLIATGSNKAAAIRELVEGSISAHWPATILQMHPRVTVLVDEAAASELKLRDFYQERWELQ